MMTMMTMTRIKMAMRMMTVGMLLLKGVVLHKERSSTQGGQIAQLNPEQCALRPLPPPPSFYVLPPSSRKGEYDTRQYISVQCVM